MATFSPKGRGHACLAAAELEPVSFADMCQAQGVMGQGKQRRKLFLALLSLRSAGFVRRVAPETYVITPEGSDALACLRAGHEVTAEIARHSVRVFA